MTNPITEWPFKLEGKFGARSLAGWNIGSRASDIFDVDNENAGQVIRDSAGYLYEERDLGRAHLGHARQPLSDSQG